MDIGMAGACVGGFLAALVLINPGPAPKTLPVSAPTPAVVAVATPPVHPRTLTCLTQAVYYEARGESVQGQAAVAQVVLNRTRHPAFPASVCGVVFQGVARGSCQFSFACDGAMQQGRDDAAWARARLVAQRALQGYVMVAVGQATNFHATRLGQAYDGQLARVARVGGHIFLAAS